VYLFYSSLRFTPHVDSNFSAFRKTYTNILCIYHIFFTPCNTCKGFSIYIRIPLSEGDRDIVYKLKKRNYIFYKEFCWNPIILTVEKSWRLYIVTYPVHLWFPSITSTASAVCHMHIQINTHPEIHFYTVNKITRWKWAVYPSVMLCHTLPQYTMDEVLMNTV